MTRRDCQAARRYRALHPAAAFDRAHRTLVEGSIRTQKLVRKQRDAQVKLGREEFAERTFRAGNLALELRAQRAIAAQAGASRLDYELRQLLANVRMLVRGHPLELDVLREFEQFGDRALDRMPRAAREPLVHQGRDRHLPSLVYLADEIFPGHAHVVVKDLVEARVAGDLDQRAHSDSRALHVDEKI